VWCFATTDTFADALLKAANLGDDADTTAGVCGQVGDAFYGAPEIPARWLAVLHWQDEIAQIADQVYLTGSACRS
jgi:ADP-ribosyl-[dinitrogen reductase] hydrolase